MPNQALHIDDLRRDGHQAPLYLSVLMQNTPVLVATVGSITTDPVKVLPITITSGSISAVERGFRVEVETSGGAHKGTVAVRAGGTLDSIHLPIRETGQGSIWIATGDVVRVYADVYWHIDKLPEDTEDFDPDGVPVGSLNLYPPPLVCSGGHFIAMLGESGYTDVQMIGAPTDSLTGEAIDHDWTASGASFHTGTSTSANPVLRYTAAGRYVVKHVGTNAVSGTSRKQFVQVRLHDNDDPPLEVDPESLQVTADEQNGFSLSLTLLTPATLDDIPDLATVALWTPAQAFGADVPDRSNILMLGTVRRDTTKSALRGGRTRIDVISPMMAVSENTSFSKVLINDATADAWSKVAALTVKKAIALYISSYLWVIEAGFDVVFNGFMDRDYSQLFIEKNNPLEQVRELVKGCAARLVVKKTGRFEVQGDLITVDLADRDDLTTTYTVEPDDVYAGEDGTEGVEFTREHKEPLETYRARGFTPGLVATANTAIFARYPKTPATGNQSPVRDKFICTKEELLALAEAYGAEFNGVFVSSDGSKQKAPKVTLSFQGAYPFAMDFHREWITFNGYGASTNPRGINLDGFRWIFTGMSYQPIGGTIRTKVTLQAETASAPNSAIDDTPKDGDALGVPPPPALPPPEFNPLPSPPPPAPIFSPIRSGVAKLATITDAGKLVMTASANVRGVDLGPSFEIADDIGSSTVQCAARKIDDSSILIVVDDENIYKMTGIGTGSISVDTVHTFSDGAPSGVRRTIKTSRPNVNRFIVTSYHPDFGTSSTRTNDAGDTWAESTVTAYAPYSTTVTPYADDIQSVFGANTFVPSATRPFSPETTNGYPGGGFNTGNGHDGNPGRIAQSNSDAGVRACVIVDHGSGASKNITSASWWTYMSVGGSGSFTAQIRFFDDAGSLIYEENVADYASTGTRGWELQTWAGSVSGVRHVVMVAKGGDTGGKTVYVDDITVSDAVYTPLTDPHTPVLSMSAKTANVATTIAFDSTGTPRAYGTTDGGATWSLLSSVSLLTLNRLGNNLERSRSAQTVYYCTRNGSSSAGDFEPYEVIKVEGATVIAVSPTDSGDSYAPPGETREELAIADNNPSVIVLIGRKSVATDETGLFRSRNAGSTWTTLIDPDMGNADTLRIVEIGSDGNSIFVMGEDTFLYSGDLGDTFDDRSGNLPSLLIGKPVYMFAFDGVL